MRNNQNVFSSLFLCMALAVAMTPITSSCSDDDEPLYSAVTVNNMPEDMPAQYTVKSGSITYSELNTGSVSVFTLPRTDTDLLPAGTYNIDANMTVSFDRGGEAVERTLRAVNRQVVISSASQNVALDWFYYNPSNSLVFGEIYFAGTPNATGSNGLYDSFLTIYNNSDEVQYADGLAIVESKLTNGYTDEILDEKNLPVNNFTVQAVYVIPGSGHDVAIEPGKSIKIVDQAIDWSAEKNIPNALNHTDADFEWYDVVTTGSIRDTDNPDVPNLDKWFSYSATIWLPSNQCNRSYALVRLPQGMTSDRFLSDSKGDYQYKNSITGKIMNGTKCYLIDYSWILDAVNLCPTETYNASSNLALSPAADASYAAVSEKKSDKARFGKKFVRKQAGTSVNGNVILQDTNDSASDFTVVSAK